MNPYATEQETMHSMTDLFGAYRIVPMKKRQSERGELLKYFSHKLDMPIGRVAGKLGHLKDLRDLYHMKSAADAYEREGKGAWGKAWWGMLKT